MTTPSSSSSDEEKKKLTKILLEDPIEDIKLEDEIDSKRYGRNEGIAILPRLVRFVAGMFSGKSEDSFTQLLDVNNNDSSNFKGFRFDTKPPDDHYYLSNKTTFTKQLAKKIGFDYAILNKSLPDGIYVCAYESRLDLLRAAIIGAQATPYENGMFFFDLHLHSDYPNSPPSIRHHSRGEKVNPNLNADGTICLSLLGTWKGEKNESWTPSSTLLQLLISIQALVLNMKPYFNEAGHDTLVGTSEGEKSSLAYNEYAFLTNIKLMTLHMQKKPQGFEDVIEDHFRRRGPYIRKACEQYLRSGSHSQGFQQSLESLMLNLYPCLDEPLEDYGSKKPYQNEMMTSANRVKGEHREDYDTKNPFRNEMTGSASRVPRFTLNEDDDGEDDAEEDEEEKQGIVSQDATVSKIF